MDDDRYSLKRWIPEFRHQMTELEFRRERLDTDRVSSLLYLVMIGILFFTGHTTDRRNFGSGGDEIEVLLLLRLLPIIIIGFVAVMTRRTKQPMVITAGIALAIIVVSGAYVAVGLYTQTHGAKPSLNLFFPIFCLIATTLISPSSFRAGLIFALIVMLIALPGAVIIGAPEAVVRLMSGQLLMSLIFGMILQTLLQRNHRSLFARLREAEERRRRVAQQLNEAERLGVIGTLAADVAHDLNNFLTPAVMATDMLQAELEGDKPRQKLAGQAFEATKRASEMVWRLLESARSPPEKYRISVRDAVRTIREMLQDAVGNSALDLELPNADIHVLSAPQALERVLVNLVVNAGEAIAEEGGYVEVRFERTCSTDDSTPQVRIQVRDNGEGIDPTVRKRIFSPLVTTKAAGHGLGLASVKRIVEEHDGNINAWNVEQGAIFEVLWPTAPDVSAESSVSSS